MATREVLRNRLDAAESEVRHLRTALDALGDRDSDDPGEDAQGAQDGVEEAVAPPVPRKAAATRSGKSKG